MKYLLVFFLKVILFFLIFINWFFLVLYIGYILGVLLFLKILL